MCDIIKGIAGSVSSNGECLNGGCFLGSYFNKTHQAPE